MAQKKLENMSDKELMDEWNKLGEKVQADRERLKEFSQEHQKRERLKQLHLTPADLELLQGVTPEAIESEEQVNG